MQGLIIRSQSGFFTAQTEAGLIVCQLRGNLKQGRRVGDVVAVGDWVEITPLGGGRGRIDRIEPRRRSFSRQAPDPQGLYQQILIANPDQVVAVFACTKPEPHLGMLDRFLVIAEKQEIPPLIVVNKIDLLGLQQATAIFGHYTTIGYPVLYISVRSGEGLDQVRQSLAGKISLFTGPSGAGKSSLLNAIQPGLGLASSAISQATSKGRHTTVVREMYPLASGGYVADTPGLKALALWDIQSEELDGYFPELRGLVSQCQFSDCTHLQEPGCAVRQAVLQGTVHRQRYLSYLRMRFGDQVEMLNTVHG